LLAYSRSFVCQYKVINAFYSGLGDAIKCYISILDCIGALIGEQCSSCYYKGVPTVVVFEISPSHMKIFHHRLNAHNHHQVLSHAMRRLCVGSKSELRRPRFVAVTAYRCRVRFRRPFIYISRLFNKIQYVVIILTIHFLTLTKLILGPGNSRIIKFIPFRSPKS